MSLGSHVSSELSAEDRSRLIEPDNGFAPEAAAEAEPATPETAPAEDSETQTAAAPVWLQRASLVMLVFFCVFFGAVVTYLPWWTRVWDQNMFINAHPSLAAVLHNGAVRGLISGLGLVDIWIGISEAIHYRDHRP